jgi:hypothetical protein
MLAPALDVVDLEAVAFQRLDGAADVVELGARKDVVHDRRVFRALAPERRLRALRRPGDGVVEKEAAGSEEIAQLGEVGRPVREADMLEHANGGDLVVLARYGAVVLQLDEDPVVQPEPPDLLAREIELSLRERDAVSLDPVMERRVADEAAPAAADVEKALAGLQAQLAADHVELGGLRVLQRGAPAREVSAGIDHLGVEEEGVEGIRQVVVELDESLVVPARRVPFGLRTRIGVALVRLPPRAH